jgi:peptidyl-prolyl cis-trans isomerase C
MKTVFSILCCTILLAACSDEPQATVEDASYQTSELGAKAVANVGQAVITRAQLDHALAFYSTNPMVNDKEGRIKVLNDMIEEQVMYNKAVENGFDKSPEYLNNQRKLLAFEYRKFLQQKVAQSVKITDVDLKLYHQKNEEKYSKPAMHRLAIYLQRSDLPKKQKLSLKQVKEAAEYLKPEAGFGKYALESHHSHSANRAGKLPWVTKNSQLSGIPKNILETAADLNIGEVSGPIKTKNGVFLVRLMAKKSKTITPLAEIKTSLRQQLLNDRKQQALAGFIQQAKQGSKIDIIKDNIGKPSSVNTATKTAGPPGFPVK